MADTWCLSDSYLYSSFAFVGSITLFIALLKFLTAVRKFLWRESHDLPERYGKCTWALITAPTTATGHGFAVQLARLGFNLVLVGKDIERLHKTRDLLILRHGIKIRTVVADFRTAIDLSFYTDILAQVEDLDISIVVHAAGMAALSKKFHQQHAELNKQCLVANMFAPVLLSQYLIPRLQHRYHKSAIIILSGENAYQPIPGMAVASGAKAFLRQFAVAASVEYENKIDIMSVQPLGVKQRSPGDKEPESIFVVESQRFAKACLKQLGHERSTSGHWIHQLQSWAYSLFPEELKLILWVKLLLPQHIKSLAAASDDAQESKDKPPAHGYFKGIVELVKKMK